MGYGGFGCVNGIEYVNKLMDEYKDTKESELRLTHSIAMRGEIENVLRSSLATTKYYDNQTLSEGLYEEAAQAWSGLLGYDMDSFRTVLNWNTITDVVSRFMENYGARLTIFTSYDMYVPADLLSRYPAHDITHVFIHDNLTEEDIDGYIKDAVEDGGVILLRGLHTYKWDYWAISGKIKTLRDKYHKDGYLHSYPIVISDVSNIIPFILTNDKPWFEVSDADVDVYCFNCNGVLGGPDSFVTIIDESSYAITYDDSASYNDLMEYITTDEFESYNIAIIAAKLLTAEYCETSTFHTIVDNMVSIHKDIMEHFNHVCYSPIGMTTDILIDVSKWSEPVCDDDDYKVSASEISLNLELYDNYLISPIITNNDAENGYEFDNCSGLLLNIGCLLNKNYYDIMKRIEGAIADEYEAMNNQYIDEVVNPQNTESQSTGNILVDMATAFGDAIKDVGRTMMNIFKGNDNNAKK